MTPDEKIKKFVNEYFAKYAATAKAEIAAENPQVPITPQVNELWKHGSEYCFCYTGPRGELRMIYGDGATVPVMDYVIDGNSGYYRVWGGV